MNPDDLRFANACADALLFAAELPYGLARQHSFETLRARAGDEMRRMEKAARREGFADRDIDQARFAVAAFIDEHAQGSEWSGRQDWKADPLQVELFQVRNAGLEVFHRIRALLKDPSPALLVYYHCLVLGFGGGHRDASGAVSLPSDLLPTIAHKLGIQRPKTLSPDGDRPAVASGGGRRLPAAAVAAVFLVVAAAAALVFKLVLTSATSRAVADLAKLGSG